MNYKRGPRGPYKVDRVPIQWRLWESVDKSAGPDGCWLWTGTKNSNGYGSICFNNRLGRPTTIGAHRLSWILANGREPMSHICVMHSCDVPACVNPAHLSIGTHKANADDKVRKGRAGTGRKLTPEQVRWIRAELAKGARVVRLAEACAVAESTVQNIKRGTRWRKFV